MVESSMRKNRNLASNTAIRPIPSVVVVSSRRPSSTMEATSSQLSSFIRLQLRKNQCGRRMLDG